MAFQIQDLKKSHDFIDILFSNMNSALFIIDEEMKVQSFNNSFIDMFGVERSQVEGHLCGNVLGCVYTEEDQVNCGQSAYCKTCTLQEAVKSALNQQESSLNQLIERGFVIRGAAVKKYFQFACKPLNFNGQRLALLIVDDVTEKEERNQELMAQNHIIRHYNQRFKNELSLAQKIQNDLIPVQLPETSVIQFAAQYLSMDEVGGDLYDVFEIDEDKIGFYMCDVAGHGIPAALITVMVKVLVEESSRIKGDPEAMVTHLNKKLIKIFSDVYLTLFYGVFHQSTKELVYIRGGHPQPVLIRGGSYMTLLDESNPLLGLDLSSQYHVNHVSLMDGDKLLLFTDGVFEAKNPDGVMYEAYLYDYLLSHEPKDITESVDGIVDALTTFVGSKNFGDDVCVLGLEIGKRL